MREQRSIPFASTGDLAVGEPAVDPDRFRGRGDPLAGTWIVPPQPWPTPEQHAVGQEALGVAQAAIDALPGAQREVVNLRDVLGWTAAEVCEALEISEVNQRVLLHRGRSKVRAALERHHDAERRS